MGGGLDHCSVSWQMAVDAPSIKNPGLQEYVITEEYSNVSILEGSAITNRFNGGRLQVRAVKMHSYNLISYQTLVG